MKSVLKPWLINRFSLLDGAMGALVVAPWFWLADAIIDLPITLIAALFLIHSIKHKTLIPLLLRNPFWSFGFGLLWLLFLATAALGLRPSDALGLSFAWLRYPVFLLALLGWMAPQASRQQWQRVAVSFALAFSLLTLDGLFQFTFGVDLIGRPILHGFRLTGPYDEPIIGFVLTHLTPVVLAFWVSGLGPVAGFARGRMIMGLILIAASVVILLSGERLFAFWHFVGLAGLALLMAGNWRQVAVTLVSALVVISLALGSLFVLSPKYKQMLIDRSLSDISEMLDIYRQGQIPADTNGSYANLHLRTLEAIAADPWTGHGMRGARFYCRDVLGWHGKQHSRRLGCSSHPHQSWLNIFASGGVITGTLAAILALAFIANRLMTMWRADTQKARILAYLPLWAFAPLMLSPLSSEGFFVNFTEAFFWSSVFLSLGVPASLER